MVTISATHCGPPNSANGGYCAGLLADGFETAGPVEVSLRKPPPLDTAMRIEGTGLFLGDVLIAEANPGPPIVPVRPVPYEAATAASARFAGFEAHPFPGCFACGPDNDEGLQIFPGPTGQGAVAATWKPIVSDLPTTWASLDCVGGWTSDLDRRPMVLGQMTLELFRLPEIGATHIVVGEPRGSQGRKVFTASSLYDSGDLVATAEHIWVIIDPDTFGAA